MIIDMKEDAVLMAFFVALAASLVLVILLAPIGAKAALRVAAPAPIDMGTIRAQPPMAPATTTAIVPTEADNRSIQLAAIYRQIEILRALVLRLQAETK
jgi:hypothetical protein